MSSPRAPAEGEPNLEMLMASVLYPLHEELAARLADCGHDRLRPCHGTILSHLDDRHGARLTELARLVGQPKQYVGRLIDELEALGYVRRRPDPADRRSKLIVLTEHGLDEQLQTNRILAEIEQRYATALGADRYTLFRELLSAVARSEQLGSPAEQPALSVRP